jgi:AcrR family transcriptional regulator
MARGAGKSDGKRLHAARRSTYHHGSLRAALLQSAETVLADCGIDKFTLRECARRAGVSHGAPAHHFGDVRGLLSEFTAESFEQLDALMREYRDSGASDPFSQLLASGLAYVDYALAHPPRFQLMFRSDRLDGDNERLVAAGRRAYGHLEETIAAVSAAAGEPGVMLVEKAALAWSIVHGFANLVLDNAGFAAQTGSAPEGARATVETLIRLSRAAFEAHTVPLPEHRAAQRPR